MPLPLLRFLVILGLLAACAHGAEPGSPRHRVIVSTDAGGTDFDDFQSVVHLLLYTDVLDLEGLISSPYGGGRKEHILRVIGHYEKDYSQLRTHSDRYPTPDALRAITKQGETEVAPYAGFRRPTEGSQWIVQCARKDDPRPLHVLVWGGIEDLAQALHDAPDILPKLRVYFIGGPNKKWSPDAYHYIATRHPTLWMIECNESYHGWFNGGDMAGDLANDTFVATHVAGRGALGDYFAKGIAFQGTTRTAIRMGDTPSVTWLLNGDPTDPSKPGWGGQFVRAWARPHTVFERVTTAADRIEQFSVFELVLNRTGPLPYVPSSRLVIENQSLIGATDAKGVTRFRFSPKEAKEYRYTIQSNIPGLNGLAGGLTSVQPAPDAASRPDPNLPNWWTDDPSPALMEGKLIGAKTVNRWRADFLRDFAARLLRCQPPAATPPAVPAPKVADKDEVIDLPKMQVKGMPETSYGIGIAGTRDRATKKIKRLFVSEVVAGTEPARLGLKEQDEILAINGVRVTEFDGLLKPGSSLFDLLVNQPVNRKITLEVLTRQPGTFTLTSRPFGTIALAPKNSHPAHFISVPIARSPAEVYAFAANPENLPKWAAGLSGSIKRVDDEWVADSPMGKVRIKFAEKNAVGVMDHEVTLPSGATVYNPLRVQPNGTGSEVVFTLYRLPDVTDEALQKDAGRVRQDLDRLKALLEK